VNIHEYIEEQTDLAAIYAFDGAFLSTARVLRELADNIEKHWVAVSPPELVLKRQQDEKK
jgi:hypothetical protein